MLLKNNWVTLYSGTSGDTYYAWQRELKQLKIRYRSRTCDGYMRNYKTPWTSTENAQAPLIWSGYYSHIRDDSEESTFVIEIRRKDAKKLAAATA